MIQADTVTEIAILGKQLIVSNPFIIGRSANDYLIKLLRSKSLKG